MDTFGLVLAAVVHPATVQDREGARLVLGRLESEHGWISKVWADGGYAGRLSEWVSDLRRHRKIDLEIVKPKPALRKP